MTTAEEIEELEIRVANLESVLASKRFELGETKEEVRVHHELLKAAQVDMVEVQRQLTLLEGELLSTQCNVTDMETELADAESVLAFRKGAGV